MSRKYAVVIVVSFLALAFAYMTFWQPSWFFQSLCQANSLAYDPSFRIISIKELSVVKFKKVSSLNKLGGRVGFPENDSGVLFVIKGKFLNDDRGGYYDGTSEANPPKPRTVEGVLNIVILDNGSAGRWGEASANPKVLDSLGQKRTFYGPSAVFIWRGFPSIYWRIASNPSQ